MLRTFRRLLREPLLHFIAGGALLFGLYALVAAPEPERGEGAGDEIVVTAGRIRSLAEPFARQWGRAPSDDELDGLVRAYVREEALARAALALGLDRDDTIVRRRLAQKMEFLTDEVVATAEPTEAELAAFLAAHPERFRVDARFTFEQILLDRGRRRGDRIDADAAALIAELESADRAAAAEPRGDARLLPARFEDVGRRDVEAQLGADFAARLDALPVGRFVWPVESGFGPHLVRLERRTAARAPTLDEARAEVAREWAAAKRRETQEAQVQALLARYRVTIAPETAADQLAAFER